MNIRKTDVVKIIIPLLLLFANEGLYGQKNSFTQYYLNLPAINPAFTGFEPFLDLKTAYKQPWSNFSDQNSLFFVGAYGAIGKTSPTVYRNNAPRISDPQLYGELAQTKTLRRLHGIGGMVMSNRIGPYKELAMNFNYAYHLPISREISLSMGAKLGYMSYQIDFQDLVVRNPDQDLFYQKLMNSPEGKQQQVVGDFGITFYTSKLYLGLSSTNLITQQVEDEALLEIANDKAFQIIAGTQVELNPLLDLYPGVKLTHSNIYDFSWQANLRLRYKKLIYLGALYEKEVKAALLFGLTFDSRYNINYSYDYFLNELDEFKSGNHEFTLGLAIFNKYSREPRLW